MMCNVVFMLSHVHQAMARKATFFPLFYAANAPSCAYLMRVNCEKNRNDRSFSEVSLALVFIERFDAIFYRVRQSHDDCSSNGSAPLPASQRYDLLYNQTLNISQTSFRCTKKGMEDQNV